MRDDPNGDWNSIRIGEYELERIKRANGALVPAAPGTLRLHYCPADEQGPALVWRNHVVAFREDIYGGLEPITLESEQEEIGCYDAVLFPNGGVGNYETYWDDEDQWFASMESLAEQDRVRALAAQQPSAA